jgi:hypothetical protein
LAEWRSDIAQFVDRAIVDSAVMPGRNELPPLGGTSYVAFVDPSGGSSDSMTLAIAHPTALIPYARNSRTHSDQQVAQIAASIREFGFTNPVLIEGVAVRRKGDGSDHTGMPF